MSKKGEQNGNIKERLLIADIVHWLSSSLGKSSQIFTQRNHILDRRPSFEMITVRNWS